MEILFATKELEKRSNDPRRAQRAWGEQRAKLVGRRLDQMRASATLAVFMTTPGHPHPLIGNRKGDFTVDLDGPYRLVFEPADDPLPVDPVSDQLIFEQVTSVRIQGVEDTHE